VPGSWGIGRQLIARWTLALEDETLQFSGGHPPWQRPRMKLRRVLAVLVAIIVIFWQQFRRDRSSSENGTDASSSATSKYQATVQEGLGASVAILLDNSGSMDDRPSDGDGGTKAAIAKDVLLRVLSQTDSFATRQPGFPVNVGLYVFSKDVTRALPIGPYDREKLRAAISGLSEPDGGTAIGDAMEMAVSDLYSAGTIRKYILVVTDGENNEGSDPAEVAEEIERRSEGAVRLFLVAFDIEGDKFRFVSETRGTLVEARNATALRAGLDTLYRGRILAEAIDAGETLPDTAGRK
jgi:hypothetical protein